MLLRFARKTRSDRRKAMKERLRGLAQPLACVPHRTLTALNQRYRRRQTFRDVYRKNLWGRDVGSEFFSGVGSRGQSVDAYVEGMARLLERHAEELGRPPTVVDLGCGDFRVGQALAARVPDLIYIGCDLVPEMIAHHTKTYANERISFRELDIVVDPLPEGDICLVRQVLQHLSNAEIMRVLQRANYQYLYVTEGQPAVREGAVNPDKDTSADIRFDWSKGRGRGVELNEPPYSLTTQEMFRVHAHPTELIITERILR
jgi:SAM-dependent methyltransferase